MVIWFLKKKWICLVLITVSVPDNFHAFSPFSLLARYCEGSSIKFYLYFWVTPIVKTCFGFLIFFSSFLLHLFYHAFILWGLYLRFSYLSVKNLWFFCLCWQASFAWLLFLGGLWLVYSFGWCHPGPPAVVRIRLSLPATDPVGNWEATIAITFYIERQHNSDNLPTNKRVDGSMGLSSYLIFLIFFLFTIFILVLFIVFFYLLSIYSSEIVDCWVIYWFGSDRPPRTRLEAS